MTVFLNIPLSTQLLCGLRANNYASFRAQHLPALDGLRVAILLVITHHQLVRFH